MAYHIPADAIPPRPMSPAQQIAQLEDVRREIGAETANKGNGSNNRRRSSTKMPGLKRAVSSPNVRALASVENAPLSPSDKKRNKLGYHRTAVACGMRPLGFKGRRRY
jgi:hypothetical protein